MDTIDTDPTVVDTTNTEDKFDADNAVGAVVIIAGAIALAVGLGYASYHIYKTSTRVIGKKLVEKYQAELEAKEEKKDKK